MKNKSMAIFVLLLWSFSVFLTGCGSNDVTVETGHSTTQQTQTQETATTQTQTITFDQIHLDSAVKSSLESKLLGKRVLTSSNFQKGEVGDYGAIGLGVANQLNRAATFKVYVDFASATKTLTAGEETITATADKELMESWIDYPKTIALNKNEQAVYTIKYIIGDKLNANEDLPPGRYKFTIEVYEVEENGHEQMYQIGNIYIDFLVV